MPQGSESLKNTNKNAQNKRVGKLHKKILPSLEKSKEECEE